MARRATPTLFWQAAALFLVCSILYFVTRSPALDEWDSVQFAMGVGDFNLWQHRPHPPGYPVYIAFGWFFSHASPLTVPTALALGSAIGGGSFVACWFLLLARWFEPPIAWVTAVCLATLLITWMTATKVLTDGLEAGLLALTLLVFNDFAHSRRPGWRLGAGAMVAALASGVRPQNTGIALLIVCLFVWPARGVRRRWVIALVAFAGGCALWLLPTMSLQAHTPEARGNWWAYPRQLLAQWRWRLDQPKAFLGATGQTSDLLIYRLEHHPLGWLTRGFGFPLDAIWGWVGIALIVLGWTFYLLPSRGAQRSASVGTERSFWRSHLPWVVAYVGMVFCCLPGDQRYYLPIFPLLILPVVAGWWWCLGRARWLVCALPVITAGVTLPYAIENHVEAAPPVQLLRWLQAAWSPAQRPDVWLILRDARRHAEWYAPEFHLVRAEDFARWRAGTASHPFPRAVYTDDALIAAQPLIGGRWLLLKIFSRSPLIYRKHNEADLYIFRPG